MRFPSPLVRGTLVRRYKRFLADVELADGSGVVVAHCANSGSMLTLREPGSEVWLSPATGAGRSCRYTWELVRCREGLVGVNTGLPNHLVAEAIGRGHISELAGYGSLRREVKYGSGSRIDLLLEDPSRPACYVEVKSVTLRRGSSSDPVAEFPDAVTARGTRHLKELAAVARAGSRAVMLYLAQREDCRAIRIAADIDPGYNTALKESMAHGVETLCYSCTLDVGGIEVSLPLPLVF
ncbi:MAG: DNA/RNA nuclease SfsA [Alphaproteobacteria bacterium]